MDEQKYSSCSFLLFQAFARLADESEKKKTEAGDADAALMVEEPRTPEELEALLEDDLVNVLTEDMDPRVTYREAVSRICSRISEEVLMKLSTAHNNDSCRLPARLRPVRLAVSLLSSVTYAALARSRPQPQHYQCRPASQCPTRLATHAQRVPTDLQRVRLPRAGTSECLASFDCPDAQHCGFVSQLDATRDRVDAIESLHRTSELTVKKGDSDLGGVLRLQVGHKALAVPDEDDEEGSGSPGDDDGAQRLV